MSAEEERLLDTYLLKDVNYWLGATDSAAEGTWRWQNSHQTMQYTNWHPGQPNGGGEDCLSKTYYGEWNGRWGDYVCDYNNWHNNIHALCQTSK